MCRPTEIGGSIFKMNISYYKGLKKTKSIKTLTLYEVYNLIRTSPNVNLIEAIRILKSNNDDYYKDLKQNLPLITPHVELVKRNLDGDAFERNFISFTNLMYFDIDDVQNVHDEKQRIINQYNDFVSLVCISPSGAGISILIQIENVLTKDSFMKIWHSIRDKEFANENIDMKSIGIGRGMFLSYDPDVYFNPDATLAVDCVIEEKQGIGLLCNNNIVYNNLVNSHISSTNTITKKKYTIYNIDYVLKQLKTNTVVEVDNRIVDFKEVDYKAIYIPNKICKGKRHKTLTSMIVILYNLNPNIEIDIIFSFIWYVNNVFVSPKLELKDLLQHFNYVLGIVNIIDTSTWFQKVKRVHFNKKCWYITPNEKVILAKKLNGLYTRYTNQNKIYNAIEILISEGKKVTNVAIQAITKNDIKTIRHHRKSEKIDFENEFNLIMNEFCNGGFSNMAA